MRPVSRLPGSFVRRLGRLAAGAGKLSLLATAAVAVMLILDRIFVEDDSPRRGPGE